MTTEVPTKNFGGFLPNPPDDCDRKEFFIKNNGVTWIDLSICHACSLVKECPDRKDYLRLLKDNRNEVLNKEK